MGFKLGSARKGSSSRLNFQANIRSPTLPVLTTVSFLLVGGGGGGGQAGQNIGGGGGGGGGGVVLGNVDLYSGTVLSFVWGGGGAGGAAGLAVHVAGITGSNTTLSSPSIITVTALGGGGGAPGQNFPFPDITTMYGKPGGSGGGGYVGGTGRQPTLNFANPLVSSQYGSNGGTNQINSFGAGGGGAGGVGIASPTVNTGGGTFLTIPSFSANVAGGGNTSPTSHPVTSNGANGIPGGYGGQAAAGSPPGTTGTAGNGGGGLIALMVPTPSYPGTAPGATVTTPAAAPGKTVLTYTSSGSYTV